jgi:release factor glutamine methyltransferase
MKKIIKKFIQLFYAPFLLWYIKTDRFYTYKGLKILVKAGVFHPGFFFSTKFLVSTISQFDIKNARIIELGAGSGLISFYCARKGAIVTATDINLIALKGLEENNKRLGLNVRIIESDLFDKLPHQAVDFVIINPPYYPKNPLNDAEKAWYCGAEFEYFEKLFSQLNNHIQSNTIVLMSLSEDCDIKKISKIALKNKLLLKEHQNKRIFWERNYIFNIVPRK